MALNQFLPRFSIRHLLVGTAFVGFACVSLKSASEPWVAIAFAVALASLAAATLLAILRPGPARAYWIGFAAIGWLYLGLLMYSLALHPNAAPSNPLAAQNLATARLTRLIHEKLYPQTVRSNQVLLRLGTSGNTSTVQIVGQATYTLDQSAGALNFQTGTGNQLRTGTMKLMTRAAAINGPDQVHFINVAHALWTLLLAALGAWFAWWIYTTRPKPVTSISST